MFGRRKDDEDPFAALKGGGTFESSPTATPSSPTPTPSYSRVSRSGAGAIVPLAIVAMIVGVGAAIVLALVTATGHTVHSISIPSFNPGTSSDNGVGPSPPSAPSTTSYLASSSLRDALTRIAAIAPGASLSLLRLDAHSLSTTAVLHGGRTKLIYFGPSGTFVTTSAAATNPAVPISAIKPSAINRVIAGMHRRFRVPSSQIDYMVLTTLPSRGPAWIVFAKTAGHPGYSATLSGTRLTPL